MRQKLTLLLLILFSISIILVGCQNTAQKRPLNPSQNNNQTTLTDSERRVLASKISNIAEQVEGVSRASVVVARSGLNNIGLLENTGSTTSTRPNNNIAINNSNNKPNIYSNYGNNIISKPSGNNPTVNYPDINANNPNTVTDDNNRNMAAPGGGVLAVIGASVNDNIKSNPQTWDQIQNKIVGNVKASDGRISQVYVTADPQIITKIDQIAAAILQGEPASTYENDIKDILSKINTP